LEDAPKSLLTRRHPKPPVPALKIEFEFEFEDEFQFVSPASPQLLKEGLCCPESGPLFRRVAREKAQNPYRLDGYYALEIRNRFCSNTRTLDDYALVHSRFYYPAELGLIRFRFGQL